MSSSPRARIGRSVRLALAACLVVTVAACSSDDAEGPTVDSTAASESTAPAATSAPATTAVATTLAGSEAPAATTAPGSTAPVTTVATDGDDVEPVYGGELVVGTIFDAFGLDSAQMLGSSSDGYLAQSLYDPLMSYTPEGEVEPWLAESLTTEDALTWTLTVRDGINFQDGTPFDAEAVKVNLDRHKDPALASRAANNAKRIESVTVLDPRTVEIKLIQPWASFDQVLAGIIGLMASPTAIAAGTLGEQPVGTGPFKLRDRVVGDRLVLDRNEDYWREGEPYLDTITFRVILDDSVRAASVENGEIQAAQSIRADELADFAERDGFGSTTSPGHPNTIHMNTQSGPTADVRVRQALAQGIDYEALADVVFDGEAVSDLNFLGTENQFFDDSVEFPTYDPDAASALIEEYEAENGPVSFTFRCYTGPSVTQMTQLVSQMWNQIGVDVDVSLSDQTTLVVDMLGGNFSVGCLALAAETNDADLLFYNQLHSTSTGNYGKYANAEMDVALDLGRTSIDDAARQEAYSTVQTLFARDLPTIEWSESGWGWIFEDQVHGLVSLPGSEFHPGTVFLAPG